MGPVPVHSSPPPYNTFMPLSIAAEKGRGVVVKELIKGWCNVNKAMNNGTKSLMSAAQNGLGEVLMSTVEEQALEGGGGSNKGRVRRGQGHQ